MVYILTSVLFTFPFFNGLLTFHFSTFWHTSISESFMAIRACIRPRCLPQKPTLSSHLFHFCLLPHDGVFRAICNFMCSIHQNINRVNIDIVNPSKQITCSGNTHTYYNMVHKILMGKTSVFFTTLNKEVWPIEFKTCIYTVYGIWHRENKKKRY